MQKIVYSILNNRQLWHRIEFSQLSELYISMSLKSLALNLIAIFIPVYFYQLGYSLEHIALFYFWYFVIRIPGNIISAYIVAHSGPKHVITYSYVVFLAVLGLLLTLPEYRWPLFSISAMMAVYNSLFFIAYHTDFSKIEDNTQAGHQISTMQIVIRVSAALGPFIGGAMAALYGVHTTLILAIGLLLLAMWPLLRSSEPIKTKEKIIFSKDAFAHWRNWVAYVGESIPQQVSLVLWPLFLSVFIFADDPYVKVGFVATISIATTIAASRVYGRIIDKGQGAHLLNASAALSAIVNPLRIFASNLGMVSLVNITSELASVSQVLVFSKGLYGEADAAQDRIAYIAVMETIIGISRALMWLIVFACLSVFDDKGVFMWTFTAAGAASLLMTLQKFRTV